MADFKNLVVLGDSMSDIGNKWTWPTGELGRLLNALGLGGMRVNETGRFSDGKNWTDFLVEWATGESIMWGNKDVTLAASSQHRALTGGAEMWVSDWDAPPKEKFDAKAYLAELEERAKSGLSGSAAAKPAKDKPAKVFRYVNYSMGGAIATRDWTPKAGALTTLDEQVESYLWQRKNYTGRFDGPTLHVIWIGLNDFVTAKRPDYPPSPTLPATGVYADWLAWRQNHPGEVKGLSGKGAFPAVAEIQASVEKINAAFPDRVQDHHFMVIDLPSVYNACRFMENMRKDTAAKVEEAKTIEPVVVSYNTLLADLLDNWPAGPHAPQPDHARYVRMNRWMQEISTDLAGWGLKKDFQDPGVPVFYTPPLPGEPQEDPASAHRNRITTSDLGHPSEMVYRLIARYFATQVVKAGHTLGRIDAPSWWTHAPIQGRPFGLAGD
ncbi:hypothetical protein ACFW9L_07400 [Streptomyces sp. NPDC059517]|uniref:hypothetical protein n=1 Tax=Streptomyces sp. NPDC059517 TaxID=3346855 RepID=UPI0036A2291B